MKRRLVQTRRILNKHGKRVVSLVLMMVMVIQLFPTAVVAQSLTELEGLTFASPSSKTLPEISTGASAVLGATTSLGLSVENAIKGLSATEEKLESARFQAMTRFHQLYKKHFGIKEKVSIAIDNPSMESNIKTRLTFADGKEVNAQVETLKTNDTLVVSVLPPTSFAPGKYTLEVEDIGSHQKITQDFTWGVLAINTNKSVYKPLETSNLALAVLDETGNMVCDASLELRISNTNLKIDNILSTENGKIKVNPECEIKDYTFNPDYEAIYKVGDEGVYQMDLTATTNNGTYSISDSFEVATDVPFDIERKSATRIYPPLAYPVEMKITALEDFKGTVVETVPESFDIVPATVSGALKHESVAVGSSTITPNSNVLGTSTSLVLPFTGNRKVTQLFGEEVEDPEMHKKYERFGVIGHDGVDFDVPTGTPVVSVDDGEVVLAKVDSDYGTTVVIKHSWGQSYYGHLSSFSVKKGDKVKKGDEIAKSGDSGLSSDPHLHFGIKLTENNSKNGYFGKIDPAPLLGITKVTGVLGAGTRSDQSVKLISWEVDVKKGETVTLGYSYKAPFKSPQFYTLGPLRFYKNNAFVYGEKRVWQIAVDATATYTISDGSSTASTVSGACDTSLTNSTTTDGAQGTVIFSTCVGRSDAPVVKWNKTLTWEDMGVPAGSLVKYVNGLYKYRVVQETHAATQAMGAMQLQNSGDTAACAASNLEASFDPGAVNAAFTTRDSTGYIEVSPGCQASTTSVTIRLNMSPVTGNNGSATSQLRADDIQLLIAYEPPVAVLDQIHYRWRNDDDNEANATFRRAEDTSMSRNKNVVMRLRFEVSNEGSASASLTTYRLEYGTLATTCAAIGTWTAVPTSPTTEHFDIEPDANSITDGSATTNVTVGGGLTNENTTFVAGEFKDTGNTTSGISLTTSQYTELEYALKANTNSATGTTYCFRVTNAGSTTTFRYTQYAQWTVGEPTMDQNHYRWRNDDGSEGSTPGLTLYFNPTGNGFSSAGFAFSINAGCSAGSEWDCVDDGTSDTQASAPTSDDTTSSLQSGAAGTVNFTLADDALPAGSIVTQLDISMWATDTGNPDNDMQLGYCITCDGASDILGSPQTTNIASNTEYTQQFTSLSLSTTDMNNMQLVVDSTNPRTRISTVYVMVTYTAVGGASWKQAEDTEHSGQSSGQNIRLRVEVANTGAVAATRRLQIAYAERTGGTCGDEAFVALPTSAGSEFQMTNSTHFTNEDATTTQMTATGSFTAGKILDTANQPASGFSITNGNYTEMEYNFLINSSAASKTWCFKLTDNGTDLDTYTRYPVLAVSASGPTLEQIMRHGKWFNGGVRQPFTF